MPDIITSTYTYGSNQITIEIHESPCQYDANVTMNLTNSRLSVYNRNDDEKGVKSAYKYKYIYTGEYLSTVTGNEDWSE